MHKIVECVPNFSEGRDFEKINKITHTIKSVKGIKLLDIDPGKATNRTVITFIGEPETVIEAAFRGIKKAAEIIDMRKHSGEHPRFGATDVCPLVPVANVTMEETVKYAHQLAERVGTELRIPVYSYESAAFREERKNLANCRSGGYEALKVRINTEKWKPDFGPSQWTDKIAQSGATAIGARNFLVAFNINLNTTSVELAKTIASEVRESGRIKRHGIQGVNKVVSDKKSFSRIPGSLKKTRAIGWYIEEYGMAQVSMNLTDISVTPVHIAFEEVRKKAQKHGVRVTGSELVGLIPLQAMLDAGEYFLRKQGVSTNKNDQEIIQLAIKSLGLDELGPFDPKKKIIEYQIANSG